MLLWPLAGIPAPQDIFLLDTVASAYVKRKLNVLYLRNVTLEAISYVTIKDGANVFRVLNAVYGNDEM